MARAIKRNDRIVYLHSHLAEMDPTQNPSRSRLPGVICRTDVAFALVSALCISGSRNQRILVVAESARENWARNGGEQLR